MNALFSGVLVGEMLGNWLKIIWIMHGRRFQLCKINVNDFGWLVLKNFKTFGVNMSRHKHTLSYFCYKGGFY